MRDLRGRSSYVISFEPRPGRLLVRRRIDHAQNRSRGEARADTETCEIARVSFQLMDRVRLWWGILGSISDATARLERRPIAGDVWLDTEFEVYFHVRVLFRKVHKYSGDASYRSVYVDCTRLARTIDKVHEALSLSITAYPELDERTPVGFTTLGSGGVGGVRIPRGHIGRFFAPHRTALVTLQLTRRQSEAAFRFRRHPWP